MHRFFIENLIISREKKIISSQLKRTWSGRHANFFPSRFFHVPFFHSLLEASCLFGILLDFHLRTRNLPCFSERVPNRAKSCKNERTIITFFFAKNFSLTKISLLLHFRARRTKSTRPPSKNTRSKRGHSASKSSPSKPPSPTSNQRPRPPRSNWKS